MIQANYLEILRKNGYRITTPRLKIIKEITNYPQSAKEIYGKLDNKSIDLVTVYRTLEILTSLNLISRNVYDKNGIKYESLNAGDHHHHLICESCGAIKDVDVNDKEILKSIIKKYNFSISSHILEVRGFCVACYEKN